MTKKANKAPFSRYTQSAHNAPPLLRRQQVAQINACALLALQSQLYPLRRLDSLLLIWDMTREGRLQ